MKIFHKIFFKFNSLLITINFFNFIYLILLKCLINIRILNNLGNFTCIDTPLINIGVSESQVTNNCLNIPEVEIPELGIILNKFGVSFLKNIKVYDAVWRILRNVKINSKEMLFHYSKNEWPEVILNMIKHQSLLPYSILKIGPVSKLLMIVSYLNNKTLLK